MLHRERGDTWRDRNNRAEDREGGDPSVIPEW